MLYLLCGVRQVALGEAVEKACKQQALSADGGFKFLYDTNLSIKQKIEAIAIGTYGAAAVEYLPQVVPFPYRPSVQHASFVSGAGAVTASLVRTS